MTITERPATESRWRAVAASHQGSSHERVALPCQDASAHRSVANGSCSSPLVAAVSDGSGSAPMSHIGSRAAVDRALSTMSQLLSTVREQEAASVLPTMLRQTMISAHIELERRAQVTGRRIGDFAATLLLAVQWGSVLGVTQVGDGGIVAGDSDDGYFLATLPERGQYANETRYITSMQSINTPQVEVYADIDCRKLAMFSDGIQNLVLDYGKSSDPVPFAPFFDRTFEWFSRQPNDLMAYSGLRRFLNSPNVRQRTDDDVTLLLATR